jgi:ferredoxin
VIGIRRIGFLLGCVVLYGLCLVSCSSSSSVSLSITQAPPSSMAVDATAAISATVSNDSSNKGVDWTATCGSTGACGSFNPTHTNSGSPTTYTAPASVPTGNTVTVTATATASSSATATSTLTITSTATAISVFFAVAPPKSLAVNQSTTATAVVLNDSTNAGVDWTVTCGSVGACGTLNPTHTTGGEFTNYTAPGAVPTGGTVILTAASTKTPTAIAQATITITP